MIDSVKYYACGYCVNHMKYIVKNPGEKKRKFYAGVYLIHHKKLGYILFDTGYSRLIYDCGIKGILYRILNPTYIKKEDTIYEKLKKDGISPRQIQRVILSHLHPDHIGCTRGFKQAEFMVSKTCMEQYRKGKIRDLIFEKLLPEDFQNRVREIEFEDHKSGYDPAGFDREDSDQEDYDQMDYDLAGFDPVGDGSMRLIPLEGHAKGQMGLYLPESKILLAADGAWGVEFLDKVDEMSIFARLVQNDFKEYKKGFARMKRLKGEGIKIYFSHEDLGGDQELL